MRACTESKSTRICVAPSVMISSHLARLLGFEGIQSRSGVVMRGLALEVTVDVL